MAKKERSVVMQTVLDSANGTTIPVLLTTAVVYTKIFRVDDAISAGITVMLGVSPATGSANITGVIEQSSDLPDVEGSAHPSYVVTDSIMNTFSTVATYTQATITLRGLKYARCRFTAAAPNTSAYAVVKFSKQVEG